MATEKRLIYLDEAIAKVKDDGVLGGGFSDDERIDDVCDILESCHIVDAVEVVHGRWEDRENPQWKAYDIRHCSVCGWNIPKTKLRQKDSHWNYCPNCGADMRGDGDG